MFHLLLHMMVPHDQLGKRNYARNSSMFIYKGDYLTLREVVLSYRLPGSIVSKMKMTGMEFSVTGQNHSAGTGRAKPNKTSPLFAIVKTVSSGETEDPKKITQKHTMAS